jgi:copper chaperone CopZ
MLECLTLTAEHGDHLLEARCLSDTLIASRLYASTPGAAEASGLCLHLAERFNLHGLPGFYREAGCWHLNTRHGGILIPVCDAKGRVVAIQIRRDAAEPRYVWLSSSGLLEGTSSSAPIHFAQPDLARVTGRAVITEGPLKADICAARLSGCVIGIPGVSAFPSDVGESLRRDLEGLREVAIAYDADKREKQEVKQAIARLSASLKEAGIRAKVWDWDISEGKGLDDYLLARGKLAI